MEVVTQPVEHLASGLAGHQARRHGVVPARYRTSGMYKPTTSGVGLYRCIGVVPVRRPSACAEVAVLVSTPQEL